MPIERTYSKAKAVGNHVVWTNQEIIPVPFKLDGVIPDGAEFGIYRQFGRAAFCVGYHAEFNVPAKDRRVRITVNLCTIAGVVVPGSQLILGEQALGGDKIFSQPVAMPTNSAWKFIVQAATPSDYVLPEGLTVTYLLRYANGAVTNAIATS